MAGQSHVNQAGHHHGHTEHPSGGQERKSEEISHNLRGFETGGNCQTGGHAKHLSAGEAGEGQRKNDDCEK